MWFVTGCFHNLFAYADLHVNNNGSFFSRLSGDIGTMGKDSNPFNGPKKSPLLDTLQPQGAHLGVNLTKYKCQRGSTKIEVSM